MNLYNSNFKLFNSNIIQYTQMHYVPELLVVIQAISNHKLVGNEETYVLSPVIEFQVFWLFLVECNANLNFLGTKLVKLLKQFLHCSTGIVHIFNHQHVLAFNIIDILYFNFTC